MKIYFAPLTDFLAWDVGEIRWIPLWVWITWAVAKISTAGLMISWGIKNYRFYILGSWGLFRNSSNPRTGNPFLNRDLTRNGHICFALLTWKFQWNHWIYFTIVFGDKSQLLRRIPIGAIKVNSGLHPVRKKQPTSTTSTTNTTTSSAKKQF